MKSRWLEWTLIGALFGTTACSSLPGLKSARRADFAALRETLKDEDLKPKQVRRLAEEVLKAEIIRAKDREDRPFIAGLGSCSGSLHSALKRRSQVHDGVGAEAALLLLEDGFFHDATSRFADEEDGAWRALSARDSKRDDALRRRYFTDVDERVRRAALLAALEAGHDEDVDDLLEVARLDPDPLTRNRAYQALGKIGTERVALALRDRFSTADEELRLAIVDAWGQKGVYERGGRRQLARLLTHETGLDALVAASILARETNESLKNRGVNRLLYFADEGTTDERRMAARLLPSGSGVTTQKLKQLTKSNDEQVALIAWARLLGDPQHRDTAQKALLAIAREETSVGFQARAALAATGDERILPFMKKQMTAKAPQSRQIAGTALVRLGAFSELAPLLADPDPQVRHHVACRTVARAPIEVK